MNMMPSSEGKLKIFYTATSGSAIAAQEIEVNGGIRIRVRHPATFGPKEDETGFDFKPVLFVTTEMTLYATALLGETEMPENVRTSYLDYIRRRERETGFPN